MLGKNIIFQAKKTTTDIINPINDTVNPFVLPTPSNNAIPKKNISS